MRNRTPFKIEDLKVLGKDGLHSLRTTENKIEIGENSFRFVFASSSLLQEMTIYIDHSRQVYDPERLQDRNVRKNGGTSTTAALTPFDVQISSETETDVFRIAVPHMKQVLKDGVLTVDVKLPIREAMTLQMTDNKDAYYGKKPDLAATVEGNLNYGVDKVGVKVFAKIVAVNEGLQKISVSKPEFRVWLSGKKGNTLTPEIWEEFNRAFVSIPDTNPASPFCRDKLK